MTLKLLRIEIVCFRHIKMRYDVIIRLIFEHISIKHYIVEVLVIFLVLKVVYYC